MYYKYENKVTSIHNSNRKLYHVKEDMLWLQDSEV